MRRTCRFCLAWLAVVLGHVLAVPPGTVIAKKHHQTTSHQRQQPQSHEPQPIISLLRDNLHLSSTQEVEEFLPEKVEKQMQQAKAPTPRTFITKISKNTVFVSSMAFLAGCMDVVFYKRFGCYVNMMTGNTIRFATSFANAQWMDAAFFLSLIVSYTLGAGICRIVDLKVRQDDNELAKTSPEFQLCAAVAPLVLLLFALADFVALTFHNRIYAPILSLAFGIINAASSGATGGTILYAMTGHLMKLASYSVDNLLDGKARQSWKFHGGILGCFVAGIGLSSKISHILIPIMNRQSNIRLPLQTIVGALYTLLLVWYGMSASVGLSGKSKEL